MSPIQAPQEDSIQRILFVLGFALVFGVASFFWWAYNDFALGLAKQKIRAEFISFQAYGDSLPLPSLKIRSLAGNDVQLKQYEGSFILLNLWATWCAPCIQELPTLQMLKDHYWGKNFTVLAVSVDEVEHPVDLVAFLKKYGIQDVAYYHDFYENLQKALPYRGLPTSFLIDPEGRILYEMGGGTDWYTPDMLKFLDAAREVY